MDYAILLYGATGYTGRLIAAEGARQQMSIDETRRAYRMILAGRDGPTLKELADVHRMDYRVFGLDDHNDIVDGLSDIDVVINAAGPFAWTAERVAKAALEADCHYVDINGEVDVYKRLDDLGRYAAPRELAIVCSAGQTAAASDLLLDAALQQLLTKGVQKNELLGAVRIAMSRVMNFSRGSAETLARSLREQVTVVRKGIVQGKVASPDGELLLWHEPVGKLERTFDFRDRKSAGDVDLRIASAANLVDTLTARLTVRRHELMVQSIESYVESNALGRIGYQIGALLAPMSALPWVRALVQASSGIFPEGPTVEERNSEGHIIVLEIEDANHTRVIDWQLETPNVYQLTAQLVVAIAAQVATGRHSGWCTPAEVLRTGKPAAEEHSGALRGSYFVETIG